MRLGFSTSTVGEIYFLPGRGSSFNGRLGTELKARGWKLVGRVLEGEFLKLTFPEQIELISEDLQNCDSKVTPLIAHSFGGYLALHAILANRGYIGRVLLISPIVSAIVGNGRMFRPPQSKKIVHSLDAGTFPKLDIRIVVGDLDWQSPIEICKQITESSGGSIHIAQGKGHQLGAEVVKHELDMLNV